MREVRSVIRESCHKSESITYGLYSCDGKPIESGKRIRYCFNK